MCPEFYLRQILIVDQTSIMPLLLILCKVAGHLLEALQVGPEGPILGPFLLQPGTYDNVSDQPIIRVREMGESESGQMMLKKVKWTDFNAYL